MEPTCNTTVDIGFVLDSSGSLRADYSKEKSFLKVLAASFGISDKLSRAGVVTFSLNAEHSIKLSDHKNFSTFGKAVDKIPLMGSTTRIDRALRLSQNELFSLSNGARPGVPKLMVILTDGSQTNDIDAEDPSLVADEIRRAGIRVLVIGIGDGVNPEELLRLAGDKDNVFSAKSFDDLISYGFIDTVTKRSCDQGIYDTIKFMHELTVKSGYISILSMFVSFLFS